MMPSKQYLKGKTIGTNYIVGLSEKQSKHCQMWDVRCVCGHIRSLDTYHAKKSQKCRWCAHKGDRPYRRKRPYEAQYNIFKNRARYPVKITYEQYKNLAKQTECHYCGDSIVWNKYRDHRKKTSNGSNLDRKDNKKPYSIENVVVCCMRCNYGKGSHFTYNEWKEIGDVIRKWKHKPNYTITPLSGNN